MKRILVSLVVCLSGFVASAQTYNELVHEGLQALAADSLELADSLLRVALKVDPTHRSNASLYRYLGLIQDTKGDYTKAEQYLTMAVNLSPRNREFLLDRASLHYRNGSEQRALLDYNSVLDIDEDNTQALFMRAHIFATMRDNKRARQDYEHLLRLDPWHEQALLGMALLNDVDGRPHEALEQINSLIQQHPRTGTYYAVRGGMEHKRKQYEVALHDLTHAIQLEGNNPDFYMARTALYMDMHKKKLARQDAQMAVKYGADPRDVAAYVVEKKNGDR